jgi:hypothetical protein
MRRALFILVASLAGSLSVQAGMTVYDLNDVVRLRLEDISFFAVLLLLCALGVKLVWNYLAKGLPALPRINFLRAACLTGILGLMMLLVLSMISGARELLTPGVWRRQGSAYRLNDTASEPLRRQSLEFLRSALRGYAEQHGGKYPPHDFVPEIPEKFWQTPDSSGTRYIYIAGLKSNSGTNILTYEPASFGDTRWVLFANGEVKKLSSSEIHRVLGIKAPQR